MPDVIVACETFIIRLAEVAHINTAHKTVFLIKLLAVSQWFFIVLLSKSVVFCSHRCESQLPKPSKTFTLPLRSGKIRVGLISRSQDQFFEGWELGRNKGTEPRQTNHTACDESKKERDRLKG